MKTENWINTKEHPIPKDGKEYLTKNDLQGCVLSLIRWDPIHKHYTNKGSYVYEGNAGTHWIEIPD